MTDTGEGRENEAQAEAPPFTAHHRPLTARHSSLATHHVHDPLWVRCLLIGAAVIVVIVLIVVPVAYVFIQAFAAGAGVYFDNLFRADTRHAMALTLLVASLAVLANLIFGLAAAWAIAHFHFPGRTLLLTLIDVPFSVSPVVAGLAFVLLFGAEGYFGPVLQSLGIDIIFATPGLILATAFVTFPFIARELIPLMETLGPDEELAAISLGATGWQTFFRVTVPNIRWGLWFGVILCMARAMGEFGAVYVVSGHVVGQMDTMPLRVERLYQDMDSPGSFAVASVLTLLALVTLLLKSWVERKGHRRGAKK
jgi:sulfate/thiosulfate transport system permease protein